MEKQKRPSQIQIPEELFARICAYFLLDRTEPEQVEAITAGLQEKFIRMQKRKEFTQYIVEQKNKHIN